MLPDRKASAQHWIDSGFATPSVKGKKQDLSKISFSDAEAQAFVYLNGRAAELMDHEAIKGRTR